MANPEENTQEEPENHERILFRYHSDIMNQEVVETMWGEKVESNPNLFRLDSIPFYGPTIATGDEFLADFDETEGMFTYRETTQFSGNSIVVVVIVQEGYDIERIRDRFIGMECDSEKLNEIYFSMEIKADTDYKPVKILLEEYNEKGILDYAEPCLSKKHRKDMEA